MAKLGLAVNDARDQEVLRGRAGCGRVWPHILRHSCGFALANKGADFRVIQDHRSP